MDHADNTKCINQSQILQLFKIESIEYNNIFLTNVADLLENSYFFGINAVFIEHVSMLPKSKQIQKIQNFFGAIMHQRKSPVIYIGTNLILRMIQQIFQQNFWYTDFSGTRHILWPGRRIQVWWRKESLCNSCNKLPYRFCTSGRKNQNIIQRKNSYSWLSVTIHFLGWHRRKNCVQIYGLHLWKTGWSVLHGSYKRKWYEGGTSTVTWS